MMLHRIQMLFAFLLLSPVAWAEGAAGAPNPMNQFIFIGMIILVMYFFIFRPQNKKMREHQNLVTSIQAGDEILTNGGIVGIVSKVKGDYLLVNVANGMDVCMQRHAVSKALPKGSLKELRPKD